MKNKKNITEIIIFRVDLPEYEAFQQEAKKSNLLFPNYAGMFVLVNTAAFVLLPTERL